MSDGVSTIGRHAHKAAQPRFSLPVLAAFGLPGLPLAALTLPLYIYLPTYYADTLGLGLGTVGVVLLAARAWDMITDPVVGIAADRVRIWPGQRRGWMLAGLPLTMAGIWMVLVPPAGAGAGHLLVWSLVLHLGGTMMVLSQQAWGAELSTDYDERARIATIREVFVILGTLGAIALPALAGGTGGTAVTGAGLMLLALAIMALLPLTSAIAAVVVPEPAQHQGTRPARGSGPSLPRRRTGLIDQMAAALRPLRRNRPFRFLVGAYVLNGIANGLPATLFLLYVGHVLGRPDMAGPLLFVYFAAGILGAPGWLWLSTRVGKHRAWSLAMLLAATGFLPAALLGTGDLPVFLAICILTGLTLGADLALPNAIQADVIDLDRLDSGRERAGLFFALWGFATKASLALGVGLAFPLLEAAGFNPAITTAPAATGASVPGLWALALIYGALPVPFKILAVILVRRFPLDRATQTGIAGRIARAGAHAGPSTATATATATATPSAGTTSCAASSATPEAPSSRSRPSSPSLDAVR